jgi:proton-dependent oligopeptide transporter, POT family
VLLAALQRRNFFGHPPGFVIVSSAELAGRVSLYGMQALLVLYMVEQALLPGHVEHIAGFSSFRSSIETLTGPLSTQALASQIFGLYMGVVAFSPFLGGICGDRILGRRRTTLLGGLLMVVGSVGVMFERSLLGSLLLLGLGRGLMQANLISQISSLYEKDDPRRGIALQIYYWLTNIGAFITPMAVGLLADRYGWHYGFAFLGIAVVFGLSIYIVGSRLLPKDTAFRSKHSHTPLTSQERGTVGALFLIIPITTMFWLAASQSWNTYNLWLRDHVDRFVLGWHIPVPSVQSFDGIAVILLPPLVLLFWRWQASRSREPDDLQKLGIGCLLFGGSLAWLACSDFLAQTDGKVPLVWTIGYYALSNTSYIYFAPVAQLIFSRAPASVNSMMIGVYYLSIFAGSTVSGRLGHLYERLSATEFWLLHAALVSAAGILLLLLTPRLRRALAITTPAVLRAAGDH